MTKKNAITNFVNSCKPFNDYWQMQLCWAGYIDTLCRDGLITQRQYNNWGNPCTPETFKNFNKKFKG